MVAIKLVRDATTSNTILLAKICCYRLLNKKFVVEMIKKSWKLKSVDYIGDGRPNLIIINLNKDRSYEEILSNVPWNIMGHVIVVKLWSQKVNIFEVQFEFSNF